MLRMHRIFTCIWLKFLANVGKYVMHEAYGIGKKTKWNSSLSILCMVKKDYKIVAVSLVPQPSLSISGRGSGVRGLISKISSHV